MFYMVNPIPLDLSKKGLFPLLVVALRVAQQSLFYLSHPLITPSFKGKRGGKRRRDGSPFKILTFGVGKYDYETSKE
jgi:hypothetical protein